MVESRCFEKLQRLLFTGKAICGRETGVLEMIRWTERKSDREGQRGQYKSLKTYRLRWRAIKKETALGKITCWKIICISVHSTNTITHRGTPVYTYTNTELSLTACL